LTAANVLFRGIVKAQLVITILSELYSLETYVSRQPSTQLLSTLRSSEELKAIHDMCALHRACVLTNVKLKASMPASAKPASPFSAASEKSAENAIEPPAASTKEVTAASEGGSTSQLAAAGARSSEQKQDWSDGKLKNAKSIKTVLSSIPDSLRYFFQGKTSYFG
jgi:E3 ubiquitin-protein ligase HUWE1